MRWHHGRMLVFFLAFCGTVGSSAAAPPSPQTLEEWVGQLNSEHYILREQAGRQLLEAGDAAVDVLSKAVASGPSETAWRASAILEAIGLEGNETTLLRVIKELDTLSRQNRPRLADTARKLRYQQAKLHRDRAAVRIRALGGKLSGGGELAAGGPVESRQPIGFAVAGPPVVWLDEVPKAPDVVVHEVPPSGPVRVPLPPKGDVPPPPPAAGQPPLDVAALAPPPAAKLAPMPPSDPRKTPADPAFDAAIDAALKGAAEGPVVGAIADAFVGEEAMEVLDALEVDAPSTDNASALPQEVLILDRAWKGGDHGLAELIDVLTIVNVSIEGAPLTDASLSYLARLPNLADLSVRDSPLTPEGLKQFHRLRPKTRIYASGNAVLGITAKRDGPCIVSSVYYGSGAFEAGLEQGDEILAVDGEPVRDFSDLTIAVFGKQPGDRLDIKYSRYGQIATANVLLKDQRDFIKR